jgi:DNA-directed RNA polymerase subunit RPC12/RpoP
MAAIDSMVTCPYCGRKAPYWEDVYDGYGFDFEPNAVYETEVMSCKSCGKQYFATVKYTFAEVTTSVKEESE